VGLFLLLFLWLFALSGLLLNHPQWEFHNFWPTREESTVEKAIHLDAPKSFEAGVAALAGQLELSGETERLNGEQKPGHIEFRLTRPGLITTVSADLETQTATVHQIKVNKWGVFRMLHTFSGVRLNDPNLTRDWIVTRLWSFSMDAVAIGIIVMVLSSYYLWFLRKSRRRPGAIVLALGFLSCGFFLWGIRWMG
jgi:hypothetical protein